MAKNQPVNVDVDDLKKVYLHVFDAFATDPSTVEEEVEGVNAKYARQLLKVLTDHEIVVVSPGEDGDVWQTNGISTDTDDHAGAEKVFDAWAADTDLHAVTPKSEPKAKRNDVGVHPCYCGCGENVPGTSFYRPGHDARHAGVIGRLVASTGNKDHYNDLPSAKLTEKAQGIATRTLAKQDAKRKADHEKAEAKAAKQRAKGNATKGGESKPEVEVGTVRIGKREGIEARRLPNGLVEYRKGDEFVTASKSATASFKVA